MRAPLPLLALSVLSLSFLAAPALAQNSVRGPAQPVPMQIIDREDDARKAKASQPKFPNKDTAVNRQDYEMGTDHGQDAIKIGRDAATGEDVMSHTPPRKTQQQKNEFEAQPIQVRPNVWK